MKKIQMLEATAALAGAFGLAPAAFAGEGGIAGSAAFRIDPFNGFVVDAAVASAVGKTSAYAGARADTSNNTYDAFALGTGAEFNVRNNSIFIDTVQQSSPTQLQAAQANEISALAIGPVQFSP